MTEYEMDVLGNFNGVDIVSIVDKYGDYWFTQDVVADALGLDRTALYHMRKNHPTELREDIEYTSAPIDGKRKIIFSEEGFFSVCDMARSQEAVRLRKWMRQQFKIKQQGNRLVVTPPQIEADDYSDLGQDLVMMQTMLRSIADNRRRIITLNQQQSLIEQEQKIVKKQLEMQQSQIQSIQERAVIGPGEMTAIQLAERCSWCSNSGAPHNLAIILAAVNFEYDVCGLMEKRIDESPAAYSGSTEVWVFTAEGVTRFINDIDSQFSTGQSFTISPTQHAREMGYKNNRNVYKA